MKSWITESERTAHSFLDDQSTPSGCCSIIIMSVGALLLFSGCLNANAKERASRFRKGSEVRNGVVRSTKEHNVVREEGRMVVYKKRNVVDFDDSLVEGDVKNPNEFYFVHRPEEKFGSLVKKRKDFHKEMLRDTVMIR